jgi:hypothetical protein
LYAFHQFFKRPLALLLPQPVRAKLWPHCEPFPLLPLRRLAWICVLIYVGAVTHVAWDALTHENAEIPQIGAVMVTIAGRPLHWAGLLQYGSSLLGLGLLAWWSWRWYRRAPSGWAPADSEFLGRARPAIAAGMIAFPVAVGTFCGLNYACRLPGSFSVGEFCSAAFITGVDAFLLALVVLAVNLRGGSAVSKEGRYYLLRDMSERLREQKEPGLDGVQEGILKETYSQAESL